MDFIPTNTPIQSSEEEEVKYRQIILSPIVHI